MSEHDIETAGTASPVEADETGARDESAADATPTGIDGPVAEDSPVAGALAELDTLADRDLAEHPEVFERIHGQLHAALTAIDDA